MTADEHWIERRQDASREIVWRSSIYGTEYIAPVHEFAADEQIGHRDTTTTRGPLLGAHPHLGVVVASHGSLRTEVEHVEVGPVVLTRHADPKLRY